MGVSITDARSMSLWEYEALLTEWNERHATGDEDDAIGAPDWETFQASAATITKDYLH